MHSLRFFVIIVLLCSGSQAIAQFKHIKKTFLVEDHTLNIKNEGFESPETCYFGGGDGYITGKKGDGGTPPYALVWTDGVGNVIANDVEEIYNLVAGDYTLTVTDNAGCSKAQTYSVGYNCPYTCSGSILTENIVDTGCGVNSGSFDASFTGVGPYLYTLTRGNKYTDTETTVTSGSFSGSSVNNTFSGLISGSYYLTLYDQGTLCSHYASVEIASTDFRFLTGLHAVNSSNCVFPDGKVTFDINDVTFPHNFEIKWRIQGGSETTFTTTSTAVSLDNLNTGYYYVQVTDIDNPSCIIAESISVGTNANLSVVVDNITSVTSCSSPNGAASITVSGGSGNYAYFWNGPGSPDPVGEDISNLKAGFYSLFVLDNSSGCTNFSSVNSVTIPNATVEPGVTIIKSNNTSCSGLFNGFIQLTPTSATPGPFQIYWYDDANNLINNGPILNFINGGSYGYSVRDLSTGCVRERIFSGLIDITDASTPAVTLSGVETSQTSCSAPPNGAIDITVTTGSSYSVSWTSNVGFTSTSEDISFLQNGIYTVDVAVACSGANTPPTITSTAVPGTYTFNEVIVDNTISITDPDNTDLSSATVIISSGHQPLEDVLGIVNQNGITGSFDGPSGVLTLSGTSSVANYQTAMRSVAYYNIAGNKSQGVRTFSCTVFDGSGNSNTSTNTINVINQPPVLSPITSNALHVKDDLFINNGITISDADNTFLVSASVSITGGLQTAEDRLLFTDQVGVSGSYDTSTGILSLTGASSIPNYQTALRSVTYKNLIPASSSTVTRTIKILVQGVYNTSNASTTNIIFNQVPSVSVTSYKANSGEILVIPISSVISDPENNLDLTTLQIHSARGAATSVMASNISVDYSTVAEFEGTDQLSITGCDMGGKCTAGSLSIEVFGELMVYNGISPNGDGLNEYFRIQSLPSESRVEIFNRWGDKVFDMSGYDNNDHLKRFEGRNDSGKELGSGTYFYRIHIRDGRELKGYLQLRR
ncbi:MAG: gliding motility-associated C-terminal domain-containing protein [Cyclobacteriaceae bacterium]|nr:gliding motility-associated C-terminal domain-containing protein [Cyclobacteriaceae bacterium]